jgi:hypothetical protein
MRAKRALGVAIAIAVSTLGCSGSSGDDGATDALAETGADADATRAETDAETESDAPRPDAGTDAEIATDSVADADAEPPIDSIPWDTGASVGYGVASKDTLNPRGQNAFIAYGGYGVTLAASEAWATEMYRASLRDRGVRWIWAVQGPADVGYAGKEIGNSKIVAALLPHVSSSTNFVLAAAHSSGSYVAHELLGQLQSGLDPTDVTKGKVVYFDLDGGTSGLDAAIVGRLKRAYFVGSYDPTIKTYSPNHTGMQSGGTTYASAGGYYQNDATGSGCDAGAVWCVHVTVITTKPHDPSGMDLTPDYSDYTGGRAVVHTFIDAKASEAGLAP